MSLPPDQPALGAYRLSAEDRAARDEWVRWLIDQHARRLRAQRLIETALASLVGRAGVDPATAERRLRALADQLAS